MKVLKKPLLLSTVLFLTVNKVWAMEDPIDNEFTVIFKNETKSETENAPNLRDYDKEEKENYKGWKSRYTETQKLTSDVATPPQHFEQIFDQLKVNERPLAQRGEVYLGRMSFQKSGKLNFNSL